jgi:hypothetical protein
MGHNIHLTITDGIITKAEIDNQELVQNNSGLYFETLAIKIPTGQFMQLLYSIEAKVIKLKANSS